MSETMYAIRRTDGELIYDEYAFLGTSGPDDWLDIEEDADHGYPPVEYEMVKMSVEVVSRRTVPTCKDCPREFPQPAEFWGLCETHAREDDPETLDEMLAARSEG